MNRKKVIVAGGGAGGMMAAGRAAELGAEVILLEKMERPGKKILLSGNGRCNLTSSIGLDEFIPMYGENGHFLHHAFQAFFRDDLLQLLGRYGVKTTSEADGRIFPASNRSSDVVGALKRYLSIGGVQVITGTRAIDIETADKHVTAVHTGDKSYRADAVILATGGSSYKQTGSSGDGYGIASGLGHHIVKLRPALVPLIVRDKELAGHFQGITVQNIKLTSFSCPAIDINPASVPTRDSGRGIAGKKPRPPLIESRRGDLIFTHFGISGPAVLLMSLSIVDALDHGPVSISIDLFPQITRPKLQAGLQDELGAHGSRHLVNILGGFVPQRMAGALLEWAGIDSDTKASQVTSPLREVMVNRLKNLSFDIEKACTPDEAMVTAGGVSLAEIDPYTMESRLVRGLYFCGEVMDIDANTGGFNLQAAFSTGYLAGESAVANRQLTV